MRSKLLAPLVLSSMFVIPAYAADNSSVDNSGIYLGAGYGLLNMSGEDDDINQDNFDEEDGAYNFYLGAQINQMFSLEAGYIDFGKYGNNNLNTKIDGYTLGVNVGFPITDYITVYAKGGQLWWNADLNSAIGSDSSNGDELYYGAGVSFALAQNWDITVSYTRYDFEFEDDEIGVLSNISSLDHKTDYASVALQYTF